jgi:hypothetical protein
MKRVLFALLACGAMACDLEVENPQAQPSLIRIVNAAPGTTAVSAFLGAAPEPLANSLSFKGQTEGCFLIFPSRQTLSFVQSNSVLTQVESSFASEGEYTSVIVGSGTTYRAVVMADAGTPAVGNNALRFVNVTGSAGDVYVTPANAAPAPQYLARSNLAPLATSTEDPAYVQRAETDVRVRLFNVGSTSNPRADITLTALQISRRVTIVFTTPVDATDPGAFLIHPCS